MLERATACLKAGARDSLKCAQQAPRSKRRLHSTFWAHGAGGLDLPSWAVSTLPPPDLPLKDDSIRAKHAPGSQSLPSSTLPNDGLFLDFLYPPQALALLHRTQGQCCERWERRNAGRLPEGFVQVPRGYSVRSYANASGAAARDQKQDRSDNSSDNVADIRSSDELDRQTDLGGDQPVEEQASADSFIVREPSDGQHVPKSNYDPDAFGDTAGELAEAAIVETSNDPYKALRDLMAGRGVARGTDTTALSWRLYMSLSDDEKEDTGLKTRLLTYFAAQSNDVADAHCISLYYAIPLKDRQMPIYQAALTAFLRRKDVEFALGLHKEALGNIPNGHHISKELFKYAAETNHWYIAIHLQSHYLEVPGQKSQLGMFWLNISELPNLLEASTSFYIRLRRWRRQAAKTDEELKSYGAFCARLSEEALWQVLQAPWHESIPSKNTQLYELFSAIRDWHPRASNLLEEALSSLLGQQFNSPDEYAQAYHAISYLYKSYRRCGISRVPEWLLLSLLKRTVRYESRLREVQRSMHGLTARSIVRDWEDGYGKLSVPGIQTMMDSYSHEGLPNELHQWYDRLRQHYPDFRDREAILWTLIHVHARRADIRKATEAFNDVEKMFKYEEKEIPLKCWNVLIHAYMRVDDIEGAVSTVKRLTAAGMKPDERSMHSIAELLARRGDVEGVEDVLEQFDALVQQPRTPHLIGSLIQALVNNDELDRATQVLEDFIEQMKAREVRGSLTTCFNIIMTAYALRRDLTGTMKVYRWMQNNKTRTNAFTYSALMQALIHLRQTNSAKRILKSVMPRLGLRPTALHYAIVIAGYSNQGMYKEAIEMYQKLLNSNERPSLATHRTYLRAKALLEQRERRSRFRDDEPAPLQEVISELQQALGSRDGSDIAGKGPAFGYASYDLEQAAAAYVNSVMYIHGARRCLEAVTEMFRLYRVQHPDHADEPPPMLILTALMNALLHAQQYKEVELFWNLAKQQADLIAPSQTVPDLKPPTTAPQLPEPGRSSSHSNSAVLLRNEDTAEIGFSSASKTTAVQQPQVMQTDSTPSVGPRPAPARRHILTNAFRHYIAGLSRENRAVDMVTVCTRLLSQGYRLDNYAWNKLIEHLCGATPPLVLLAFTLTERFLIAGFPGWVRWSQTKFTPKRSARHQRLQHTRARYLRPGVLMPEYQTMVHLAAVYIELRRKETVDGTIPKRNRNQMQRLTGSIEEINDEVQGKLLND
ncbi:hypothetical protein PRZ48_003369 [Zasmidium cellare]|uniref:Pentatricopeptide repeat-containing protein-mitochondrial domain-containing protein n=1 Tax=Zasmidium cellare TaxID=395010 RepID=A0ABR0EW45_ZASCE|nr:hypothetical protein PRZ48_003369 [Zasmidium cellare]